MKLYIRHSNANVYYLIRLSYTLLVTINVGFRSISGVALYIMFENHVRS